MLLLEGSGLSLKHMEVDGKTLAIDTDAIITLGPLMDAWSYLVQLTPGLVNE